MSEIKITMTTFVDFVVANGTPKLTAVKNAKTQYQVAYDPAKDFYKPLRESIIVAAQQNLTSNESLASVRSVLGNLNARKLETYNACIAGYKTWRGRKNIVWRKTFSSGSSEWTQGRLVIRVTPELGVSVNGKPHIIKLYFKEDKPSKQLLETMFFLLKQYDRRKNNTVTVGILDIRRGRLYSSTRDFPDIEQLLAGEAAAFQTMWDRV